MKSFEVSRLWVSGFAAKKKKVSHFVVKSISITMKEVLVLGGESSGKSLFVRRLKEVLSGSFDSNNSSESSMPTVGVEINTITLQTGETLTLREIGSAISSRWDNYIPDCAHIVFLVDASDLGHVASAIVLLQEILSNAHHLIGKSILIALNKTDLMNKHSLVIARNIMRVEELQQQSGCAKESKQGCHDQDIVIDNVAVASGVKIEVIQGSCIDGSLCRAVVRWLESQSAK